MITTRKYHFDIEKAVELRLTGMSWAEIGRSLGVPPGSVEFGCRKDTRISGIKLKRGTKRRLDTEQLVALRLQGLRLSDIAERVGCTAAAVSIRIGRDPRVKGMVVHVAEPAGRFQKAA
jgi:hypothetical protein